MTDKAYIVANEQQEREVLEKLEREGLVWFDEGENPTEHIPSSSTFSEFPYVLFSRNRLSWGFIGSLSDEEIVFDGRKEEQMSEKYVVSQEFMDKLEEWKDTLDSNDNPHKPFVNWLYFENLPEAPSMWWGDDEAPDEENNNRLIAIIRWVNGEDVFKVEKPKKWIVRSKEHNNFSEYTYVTTDDIFSLAITMGVENATKFDTKEEAESWANAHQEVIEVGE